MKLNPLAATLLLVTAASFPARAEPPIYKAVSLELYGAASFPNTLTWTGDAYDTEAGFGIGAGIYRRIGWYEYGADLMSSRRDYSCCDSDVTATSLMLVGRRHFLISDNLDGYVGLGLGAIRVNYDGSAIGEGQGSDTVKGGQISLGAMIPVGQSWVFGEVKYQSTFDDASILGGAVEQSYDSTFAVIGYKLVF
jgi:Outer membrane protein beta-barrel domain